MDIEKLHGTDPRLYQLVAPLVMSIPVLRYNNNYPFKTSVHHKWLVATEKGVVKGFMPIDIKSTGACIDNYYVSGGNSLLLSALIDFAASCSCAVCVRFFQTSMTLPDTLISNTQLMQTSEIPLILKHFCLPD